MFNQLALSALTLLICLWFALMFDVANIVSHLGDILMLLDRD